MAAAAVAPPSPRAVAARAIGFAILWLVLHGSDPLALPLGLATAIVAAWMSVRLLPPAGNRVAPLRLAALVGRFLLQSVAAGSDVARRALSPAMPLRVGFIRYQPRLAPGPALNAFCAWTSLLPGSLPCEIGEDGTVLLHCLDTGQAVAAQIAAEEARFAAAFRLDGDA